MHIDLNRLKQDEKIELSTTAEANKLFLKKKVEIAASKAAELEERRRVVAEEMHQELQNILITKGAELG